jgi:rhamnosyltransferase
MLRTQGTAVSASTMSASAKDVGAVVLTYQPDIEALHALVDRIRHQVARIIVVDNCSAMNLRNAVTDFATTEPKLELLLLSDNVGVAAGHNHGIKAALESGLSFILILDQDSLPASDMVERLLHGYRLAISRSAKIAAVGPCFLHRLTGRESFFIRFGLLRFKRFYCTESGSDLIPADFLISSGSLIPASAIKAVGMMRDDLFIDHVDTDWFLRARELGWCAYGICSAKMEHRLGERMVRIRFTQREIPMHSPLRHYYMFRNSVYLYLRSRYPLRWKFSDAKRLVGMLVIFLILPSNRRAHLRMMLFGVWDGVSGRMGRFDLIHPASDGAGTV